MEENDAPPLLAAAFICERVLEGKDNVLSAIRMVNRFFPSEAPQEAEGILPAGKPLLVAGFVLVSFKGGDARGKRQAKVTLQGPDGKELTEHKQEFNFVSPDGGQNLTLEFKLVLKDLGVYWWDVYIGENRVTRIPFSLGDRKPQDATASAKAGS